MSEKEMKERVEDITTINFSITKCPLKIFKGFSDFCKKETSDNYAFGLKVLLESREANIKEVVLYEQYAELREEIQELREQVNELKGKKKMPRTMGSGGRKDE